jgi:chlorite dismutase
MAERTLNHYAFFSFTEAYWALDSAERATFRTSFLAGLRDSATQVDVYQVDPFSTERKRYLVGYPFVKTMDWYLMSRDARQGMMNEHIRVGHQYPEIKQLLLYSFGLQDQEFIVVYETDDLPMFSDLVNDLRATEARRYTQRDTPIFTAVYHPAETTLGLWE